MEREVTPDATSLSGRCLRRPRGRATEIVSSVHSASLTSATCALARWKPSGSPFPSMTSIHLVPFPFLVSPTLSLPRLAGTKEPSRKAMDQLNGRAKARPSYSQATNAHSASPRPDAGAGVRSGSLRRTSPLQLEEDHGINGRTPRVSHVAFTHEVADEGAIQQPVHMTVEVVPGISSSRERALTGVKSRALVPTIAVSSSTGSFLRPSSVSPSPKRATDLAPTWHTLR